MAFQIAYIFEAIDKFTKVAKKMEKHIDRIQKKVDGTNKKMGKFGRQTINVFNTVSIKITRATNRLDKFEKKVKKANFAMRFMANIAGNLKFRMASLIVTMGLMTGFGLKNLVKTGSEIEEKFLNLSALTGIVGKDLEFLNQQAFILARVFGVDVADVFVGVKRIAGLKPELIKNVEGLAEMTKQALILDAPIGQLEKTSRTLAVALNIYGKGAESAAKFTNILAASARFGSAEVNEVGLSFLKTGSVMELSNIGFRDAIALIQVLARSGLLAQAAGVGLSTVLLRLQRAGFDLKKQNIGDVFDIIGKRLEAMTDSTKRAEEVYKLFGLRQTKTGIPLAKNISLFRQFQEELSGTNIAVETASKVLEGYEKQSAAIMSIYDEKLKIIFEGISPALLAIKKQFLIFFTILDRSLPGGIKGTLSFLLWSFEKLLILVNSAALTIASLLTFVFGYDTYTGLKKLFTEIKAIESTPIKLETLMGEAKVSGAPPGNGKVNVDINLRGNTDAVSSAEANTTDANLGVFFNLGPNLAFSE